MEKTIINNDVILWSFFTNDKIPKYKLITPISRHAKKDIYTFIVARVDVKKRIKKILISKNEINRLYFNKNFIYLNTSI